MDLQDLMPELEAIFRFSRYVGPRQWAASLPELPAHGEAAALYRQEAGRLASLLERLTPHLVESSQTQLLERLIKETKGELFHALCRTLASLACAAALPALLDQYTQAGAGSKLAILDLIRATAALEGYETALAQAEARSDTGAAEELGRAAEAALASIRRHHPALRAVDLLAAGESPDWETTMAAEVTGILLQAAPLDTAVRALRHLAESHTSVAEAIRVRLLPLIPREGEELSLQAVIKAFTLPNLKMWLEQEDQESTFDWDLALRALLDTMNLPTALGVATAFLDLRTRPWTHQLLANLSLSLQALGDRDNAWRIGQAALAASFGGRGGWHYAFDSQMSWAWKPGSRLTAFRALIALDPVRARPMLWNALLAEVESDGSVSSGAVNWLHLLLPWLADEVPVTGLWTEFEEYARQP